MTADEIKSAYLELRNCLLGMVGSFYPKIAAKQLQDLREEFLKKGGKSSDLPSIPEVDVLGYVRP